MQFNFNDPAQRELWMLGSIDAQYSELARNILDNGTMEFDPERSHERWLTIINANHMLFNTAAAFPVLLGKRVNYPASFREKFWMGRGETNVNNGLDSQIWNEWASEDGSIGWGYGKMMRNLPDCKVLQVGDSQGRPTLTSVEYARQKRELDRAREAGYNIYPIGQNLFVIEGEIDQLLEQLKNVVAHSRSRRMRVQTFNPAFISMQNLPPCHAQFTFNVTTATPYEQAIMARSGRQPQKDSLSLTMELRLH